MFRSESYQNDWKSGKRRKNIKSYCPISIDEIRVVDEDLAHLLGEKC
jgi:hypothetical protein